MGVNGMPLPLSSLGRGVKARIIYVDSGHGLTLRLMQMGLVPGAIVEVLENSRGPILLMVENTKVAIGRGIAEKIQVDPISENNG